MCGICGWIYEDRERPVEAERLRRAARWMAHRGPDDEGIHTAPGIGLAMRRLAIIDLDAGRQPMATPDRRYHIVYNGECYNHAALRHDLEGRGLVFRTRCDTEVVLQGYAIWGAAVLERLNGMFAFAIYDAHEHALFAARDPLGIKPLYYHDLGAGLAFASEIKCLFADPAVPRRPDPQAISDYLTFKYIPSPATGFAGIAKLPAGHCLRHIGGHTTVSAYRDLEPTGGRAVAADEALEAVDDALRAAVQARLMSDVPLGVMLSGGVDSSLVAAHAATAHRGIDTFTIGFPDPDYDESVWADRVARHLGTQHHTSMVQRDAFEDLATLAWHLEEPLGDSSALPLSVLCHTAREAVTVALAGDGGDELGGGYPRYLWDARAARLRSLQGLLPLAGLAGRGLELFGPTRELGRRVRKFAATAPLPQPERYTAWHSCFSPAQKECLLAEGLRSGVTLGREHEHLAPWFARMAEADPLTRLQYVDLKTFLVDDLLLKADKLSMAVGLELRVPFLDVGVVGTLLSLPAQLHVQGGELKVLLKALAAQRVPREVVYRPKQGFSVPLQHWFRGGIDGVADELLSRKRIEARGWLQADEVDRLRARARLGRTDVGHQLYTLLFLEAWATTFFSSGPPAEHPG